jgi:hypothetical protein
MNKSKTPAELPELPKKRVKPEMSVAQSKLYGSLTKENGFSLDAARASFMGAYFELSEADVAMMWDAAPCAVRAAKPGDGS